MKKELVAIIRILIFFREGSYTFDDLKKLNDFEKYHIARQYENEIKRKCVFFSKN